MYLGYLQKFRLLFFCSFLGLVYACAPKIQQSTEGQEYEKPPTQQGGETTDVQKNESLSPCAKFSEHNNPDYMLESYVIMHDFVKAGDYAGALPYWKIVYEGAPAADGRRNTVFTDGIKIYEYLYQKETNPEVRHSLVDTIFGIYSRMDSCYGEDGYVPGKKAFDYYYKYQGMVSDKEIYDLFVESLERDSGAQYFIINPFTALMIKRFQSGEIDLAEAKMRASQISSAIKKGLASGKHQAQWKIIDEYASARLIGMEGVKGFYDCAYYRDKYFQDFLDAPADCDVIIDVYGKLKWGGCSLGDEELSRLDQAYNANCRKVVTTTTGPSCRDFLREGAYSDAIACYEERMSKANDSHKKAEFALIIAKIYFAHLKNFPKSRKYARMASKQRPDWGAPYMLVGKLYASSGPLCGSGRGFNSQVVTWVAIDEWNKAKKLDPSVASEAQKNINKYARYMPTNEDVFQRSLRVGASYKVPCWIQQNTVIRVAK